MEEIYFYQIEIGKISRRGNMIVDHSFICKTENPNSDNIRKYFIYKYEGFSVNVNEIKEIIKKQIPIDKGINIYGRTKNEERLVKELKKLKEPLKATKRLNDRLSCSLFPTEAKLLIKHMGKLMKIHKQKREDAENIIRAYLEEKYSPFSEKISFPDKLTSNTSWLNYNVNLNGELHTDF